MRRAALALGLAAAVALAVAAAAVAGPLDTPGATKAMTCAACHGAAGNSRSESVPILAGLPAEYFKKTIGDYAAGRRPSPEMEPIAKAVLALGVDEMAAYFAAQPRERTAVRADGAAAGRGRALAAACAACHGEAGAGDAARGVPGLAGQAPGYLRNQMALFKAGRRGAGDPAITQAKAPLIPLSEAQLADLAAYYASLGR